MTDSRLSLLMVFPVWMLIELRDRARAEIARAIFYMHQEYGLSVKPARGQLLKQWNEDDPPSWDEKRRNKKIKELQGTKNPVC